MASSTSAIAKETDQLSLQIQYGLCDQDNSNFKKIPRSILLKIPTYLEPSELWTLAKVCRGWNIILWRSRIATAFSSLLSQEGRYSPKESYLELKQSWVPLTIKSIKIPRLIRLKEEGCLQFSDAYALDEIIVVERCLGAEEGTEVEGFRYYIMNFNGIQRHGYQTPDRSLVRKINPGFILAQRRDPPYTIELWNRTDPNHWYDFPQSAAFLFADAGPIYALFINNNYELRLNFCSPFGQIHSAVIANIKMDEGIKFESFTEGFFIYRGNQLFLMNPLEKDIKTNFTSTVDFSLGKMKCLGHWSTIHTDTDYLIWNRELNQVFTGSFQDILGLCEAKFGQRFPNASFKGLHLIDQGFILDFTSFVVRFTDPKDLDVEWIDASLITAETQGSYLFVHKNSILQAYDLTTKTFITFERIPKEEQISSHTSCLGLIFLGTQKGNIYILNNRGQCIHAFSAYIDTIKNIKCVLQNIEGIESVRLVTISDDNEPKIWTY